MTTTMTTVIGIVAVILTAVSGRAQAINVTVQGQETRQQIKQRIVNTRTAVREIIAEDAAAERAARAEMIRQYRIAQQEAAARTTALMAAQAKAHAAWVKQQREQHDITHAAARKAFRAERTELRETLRTNTFEMRMAAYWASITNKTEAGHLP